MTQRLDDQALDLIFRDARSHNRWRDGAVGDDDLRAIFDLMKMGPTSANGCPARFLFVRGDEAKQRLRPHLSAGNVEKMMTAPVTAIIAYDLAFYDHLGTLFPHEDARPWFAGKAEHSRTTAVRNGTLQGAYFLIAARALGFDCGPMSGFDNAGVDAAFFAGTSTRSNFLCCLGRGDPAGLFPRNPRFAFDEVCRIL